MAVTKPKTNQNANTTNTSDSSVSVGGDFGLTGEVAGAVLTNFARAQTDQLSLITGAANNVILAGYKINEGQQATLGTLANLTQDFSQRAIAASTGQETPIQNLGKASGDGGSTWIILGTIVAVIALFKDG